MNRHMHRFFALLMLCSLAACVSKTLEKKPAGTAVEPTKSSSIFEQLAFKSDGKTVIDDNGQFVLIEGHKCIRHDGGDDPATIVQWIEMPSDITEGTVVLNGWDLRFLQHDRKINTLRTDITHSKLINNIASTFLVFEVQGKFEDQSRKDAFEFCVHYSAFGFRSDWIDAKVEEDYRGTEMVTVQPGNKEAVVTLAYVGSKGAVKNHEILAVIPRGFDFQFSNAFECEFRLVPCQWGDRTDNRLLQIAYHLSQSGVSSNLDGSSQWAVQTLFKADENQTHRVMIRTAAIRGTGVKLRTDFLPLNPRLKNKDQCRKGADGQVRTQTFRINDLPYDYAVPMLTGWDLSFECEQQKVQRAGIWLHDARFDPVSGSMEYKVSSVLRDQDGIPGFNTAHRLTILGLNRMRSPIQPHTPINILIREH
ncbi:MAG: hypothetical protein LZF61_01880 [Nitrosomonas sp.]|nr:MAG: hypothetical protein LZF61_01880 [Nitrosomonas sp.]